MLDDSDRRLLRHWIATPDASGTELADRAGLSPAAVSRRLDRLKRDGVVRGVRAVIDWRALGYEVEVSLRITLDKTVPNAFDELIAAARAVPEVIEIQTFLGRVDLRLQVLARDMPHYAQVYRERILTLPHISDIEALMQVATVKTAQGLPV
jgi:Lrp/AsnC family transcriptional regulator